MAGQEMLHLAAGKLALTLEPRLGGSVRRFDLIHNGLKIPIFRDAPQSRSLVTDAASFPLVPYCNRVRGGRFRFRGREVTIAANSAADSNPLHGHGWLAAWEILSAGETEAELRFRHEAAEWPWSYEARQIFRLEPDALTILLACRNRSGEAMPCGLGQHPFFHCTPETRLDARATHSWTMDEQMLPVAKVPASGRFDLSNRLVCGSGLDNGFGGWSGSARIESPELPFAIEMSSADAGFLQVYAPRSGSFFAAEPASHANAALNEPEELWPELGLRVLEPGEEMSLAVRFRLLDR